MMLSKHLFKNIHCSLNDCLYVTFCLLFFVVPEPNDLVQDWDIQTFQRMPCLAHSLQLSLKDAMKHPSAESEINKARRLVHSVWKSSVANEKMVVKRGKTLVRHCSTRWNSTLDMIKRLLETRLGLNEVLEELGIDTLLTSDWVRL